MRPTLLFLFCFMICSCHQQEEESRILFPEGGYAYPSQVPQTGTGFYYYPVKDSISRKDSLIAAFFVPRLLQAFDEPNLSLAPPEKPVFRLVYVHGFINYVAILTLTQQEITVKEIKTGIPLQYPDKSRLNSLKEGHLHLLEMDYPLNAYNRHPGIKKYYDSLTKVYPQLHDPRYYLSLLQEASMVNPEPFTYKKRIVRLSKKSYEALINLINKSGFWNMTYNENACSGQSTDENGLSIEGATPEQYQIVNYTECYPLTLFDSACHALMKAGGIPESFEKYSGKKF